MGGGIFIPLIIKHEYELAAEADKTPDKVNYFSLYMHMRSWKDYKDNQGNIEIPSFLGANIVNQYVIKAVSDITAHGQPSVNLLEGFETDTPVPEGRIMGTNIRSGATGKTVTGFPEGMLIHAIPLNLLSESERPASYKSADKNRALIVKVDSSTKSQFGTMPLVYLLMVLSGRAG